MTSKSAEPAKLTQPTKPTKSAFPISRGATWQNVSKPQPGRASSGTQALLVLATAFILWVGFGPMRATQASGLALAPGDTAPKVVAWDLDGKLVTLDWEGLTLLNFWATWCVPCQSEMPELQELSELHRDKGFRVIGLNREDISAQEVRAFVEEYGIDYPIMKSDAKHRWDGINVLPTSYLIDGQGKIIRKYIGALPDQVEGLKRDIEDTLHGRPLQPMMMPGPPSEPTTSSNS